MLRILFTLTVALVALASTATAQGKPSDDEPVQLDNEDPRIIQLMAWLQKLDGENPGLGLVDALVADLASGDLIIFDTKFEDGAQGKTGVSPDIQDSTGEDQPLIGLEKRKTPGNATAADRAGVLFHEYIHYRQKKRKNKETAGQPITPGDDYWGVENGSPDCIEADVACQEIQKMGLILDLCDCYSVTGLLNEGNFCGPTCLFLEQGAEYAFTSMVGCVADIKDANPGISTGGILSHPDMTVCFPFPQYDGCPGYIF